MGVSQVTFPPDVLGYDQLSKGKRLDRKSIYFVYTFATRRPYEKVSA
jgi:hypothetical protein